MDINIKIGFIGTGNMGSALLGSLVSSGSVDNSNILLFDKDSARCKAISVKTGTGCASSSASLAEMSDIVIICVKPDNTDEVLMDIRTAFAEDTSKVLVSIVAGLNIVSYNNILGADAKIIRAMPNMPAMVGAGMTILSPGSNIDSAELENVRRIFEACGIVEVLPEKFVNKAIALTASSPAYVFMLIEAMGDAAVHSGIQRNKAYKMAAQAVLGSAKMVIETGLHPAELKDRICSPGGTTIEAVKSLEKNGFRSAMMEAMERCTDKAEKLACDHVGKNESVNIK